MTKRVTKKKAPECDRTKLFDQCAGAVHLVNARNDPAMELAAFMSIFHGKQLTRGQAEAMLRKRTGR